MDTLSLLLITFDPKVLYTWNLDQFCGPMNDFLGKLNNGVALRGVKNQKQCWEYIVSETKVFLWTFILLPGQGKTAHCTKFLLLKQGSGPLSLSHYWSTLRLLRWLRLFPESCWYCNFPKLLDFFVHIKISNPKNIDFLHFRSLKKF